MYISVEINNNAFSIHQVANKPQEHNLAVDTLEKLKLILDAKMKPQEGTEFATLSKQELRSKIKELSSEIAGKYEEKRIRCEWRICRLIREIFCRIGFAKIFPFLATQKKIEALQQEIALHTPPTKKFLKPLVEDVKCVILSYLDIAYLKNVSLVCKNALVPTNRALFQRARSFGYQGANTVREVRGYVNMLQRTIYLNASDFKFEYRYALRTGRMAIQNLYARALSRLSESLDYPNRVEWEHVIRNFTRYSSDEMIDMLFIFTQGTPGHHSGLVRFFLQCTQNGIIQVTPIAPNLALKRDNLLYWASGKGGDPAAVLLFLLHGADLERQVVDPQAVGRTPLAAAAEKGHKEIVSCLLERGAKPNNPAGNGSLPLHFAAQQGKDEVVQLLLDNNARIDVPGVANSTALLFAVQEGKLSTVKLLLRNGADSSIPEQNGSAPLHFAAQQGNLEIVEALLDSGANINSLAWDGRTALLFAAEEGKTAVVEELLKRGADPLIPDVHGSYPFHFAAQGGHVDSVYKLLPYMPNLDVPGAGGHTALEFARRAGKDLVVNVLSMLGATRYMFS